MYEQNYQLTFEQREAYLYVRLIGEDSFAASLSYWNEIADKVKTLACRKVLVHEDMIGEVSDSDMHELVMDLLPSGLNNVQIAFFDENPKDQAVNHLGQSLANTLGGHVKTFESLKSAREWLTEDD